MPGSATVRLGLLAAIWGSSFLGAAVLGETITWLTLAGIALILAGVALTRRVRTPSR